MTPGVCVPLKANRWYVYCQTMTTEKLFDTLSFILKTNRDLKIQTNLDAISSSLTNLVNTPAATPHQSALAAALASFSETVERLSQELTPSISIAIGELGGSEFFDPAIADKVQASISANAMTPSVARDFVQDLSTRRAAFLEDVRLTLDGLKKLGIESRQLPPGTADLAFSIPRDLFANDLSSFATELTFISRLMQHFNEALTGSTGAVELETLSSSIPTVALLASPAVIALVAHAVTKFLDAWERIERIRKLRAEISEMGMKGAAVKEMSDEITKTVSEVVEETVGVTLATYNHDPARKNELRNAIEQDVRRLFGQIERGLTVHFRAEKGGSSDEKSQLALEDIDKASRTLEFPEAEKEPLLLGTHEILEGEITVHHSTTKTTRTVTKQVTSRGRKLPVQQQQA